MSLFILLTGLPCSGKTTIAKNLQKQLVALNYPSLILDGDSIRKELNSDLGFSAADRFENIRRIGSLGKIAIEQDLICIASIVSPYEKDRIWLRNQFKKGSFYEIYLSTPLEICIKRDVKGMYKKALAGEISNFTGIDGIYEIPKNPDMNFDTSQFSINEIIQTILNNIQYGEKLSK